MTNHDIMNEFVEGPAPSTAQMIADLRQKVLDGQEPSAAEYALVLAQLRRSRTAAPAASGRKKAEPMQIDLNSEFS